MSIRARIAIVIIAVLALVGMGGAAAQAGTLSGTTDNDACVVVPPAKVAVCLQRF